MLRVNLSASDSDQIFLSFSEVVKPQFWDHLENLNVEVFAHPYRAVEMNGIGMEISRWD